MDEFQGVIEWRCYQYHQPMFIIAHIIQTVFNLSISENHGIIEQLNFLIVSS